MGTLISNSFVVEDSSKNYFNNMPMCIIPQVNETKLTEAIYNSNARIATIYSQAINVTPVSGIETETILTSSDNSYIKNTKDSITYAEGDKKGPFALAALAKIETDSSSAAEVLFLGNSYYMHSTFINDSGFANKDFLVNAIKYITGSTSLLSIGPKNLTPSTIAIDASQANFLTILVIIIIPLAILACGVIVWIRRKNL